MHLPVLSLLIWLPMLGAVPVLLLHRRQHVQHARWVAVFLSLALLVLCVLMVHHFDTNTATMQFRETISWVPSMHLYYDVGVDGISLPLIILTCFTTFIIVLASW